MSDDHSSAPHLLPAELTAWLTAGRAASGAGRIGAHLADCAECRGEAIEVARMLRAVERPRRWKVGGLALAATVLFALWFGTGDPAPSPVVRGPSAEDAAVATALTPIAPIGAVRRAGSLAFAWHRTPAAAEYRFTLLDGEGTVIWTDVTADSTAVLPLEISLVPGAEYFWYVDALQANGTSTTSRAQAFRLVP